MSRRKRLADELVERSDKTEIRDNKLREVLEQLRRRRRVCAPILLVLLVSTVLLLLKVVEGQSRRHFRPIDLLRLPGGGPPRGLVAALGQQQQRGGGAHAAARQQQASAHSRAAAGRQPFGPPQRHLHVANRRDSHQQPPQQSAAAAGAEEGQMLVCYYTNRHSLSPLWAENARKFVIPADVLNAAKFELPQASQHQPQHQIVQPPPPQSHFVPVIPYEPFAGMLRESGLRQNGIEFLDYQQAAALAQPYNLSQLVLRQPAAELSTGGGRRFAFDSLAIEQSQNRIPESSYQQRNELAAGAKMNQHAAALKHTKLAPRPHASPPQADLVAAGAALSAPANENANFASVYETTSAASKQAAANHNVPQQANNGAARNVAPLPISTVGAPLLFAPNGNSAGHTHNNENRNSLNNNKLLVADKDTKSIGGAGNADNNRQDHLDRQTAATVSAGEGSLAAAAGAQQQLVLPPSLSRAFVVGGGGGGANSAGDELPLDTKAHLFISTPSQPHQQPPPASHGGNYANYFQAQPVAATIAVQPPGENLPQRAKSGPQALDLPESGGGGTAPRTRQAAAAAQQPLQTTTPSSYSYRNSPQAQQAAAATGAELLVVGSAATQTTFTSPAPQAADSLAGGGLIINDPVGKTATATAAAAATSVAASSSTGPVGGPARPDNQPPGAAAAPAGGGPTRAPPPLGQTGASPLSSVFDVFGAASQYLMRFKPSSLISPSSFAFNSIAATTATNERHHYQQRPANSTSPPPPQSSSAALLAAISPASAASLISFSSGLLSAVQKPQIQVPFDDRSSSGGGGGSGAAPQLPNGGNLRPGGGFLSRFTSAAAAQQNNQRREDICGRTIQAPERRIIGGEGARYGEFPYQVHIKIAKHQCGGALVDRQSIVTAAHCVYHFITRAPVSKLQIVIGAYDIEDEQYQELPPQYFKVNKVKLHPNFRFSASHPDRYDIAILKLDKPVKYTDNVLPVCLPARDLKFESMIGTVTGFGKTDPSLSNRYGTRLLQKVDVPIIDNNECERWHRTKKIDLKIFPEMMCAGYEDGLRDACVGDSGGPLVVKTATGPNGSSRWTLAGITSAGFGCAQSRQPGIYHRVSHTVDWILENLD